MMEFFKKLFSKKTKKENIINKKDALVLAENLTYENEVKKSPVKETRETKSSLTIGV